MKFKIMGKSFLLKFEKSGIRVMYYNDEVIWLWPWERDGLLNWKWYSIYSRATWRSLKQLRSFWDEYDEAVSDTP